MNSRNLIIIFVKAPIPGFVKTRLAKDIGNEKACELYIKFTLEIIKEIIKTGFDMEIHYFPEKDENLIKNRFGNQYKYCCQKGKDLGEKMSNSISNALSSGYEKTLICGSDIPDLKTEILIKAFKKINKNPVIGPCDDGGYYLIGADKHSFHKDYFQNIEWSTDSVLKKTLAIMKKLGLKPVILEKLNDIDTIQDLKKRKNS